MPELPEVETFKVYFDTVALQQSILKVEVHDDKILRNCSGESFADRLKGQFFQQSFRHGKYLFGKLQNGHAVLFHFGMTGDFVFYTDASEKPRYERFVFRFPTGSLAFDCPRKFARILYLEDIDDFIQKQQLGPDALLISENEFFEALAGKTMSLKGFLLNQKALAGVGNLYADEICYQARVHPASPVDKISRQKLKTIFDKMKAILQKAVQLKPYYKSYPDDWFWQWRKEGVSGPNGKGKVVKTKIAARTTYYCAQWQKKYS